MQKIRNNLDPKRIVLGMSGGVDSSISLMLLKNAGYEVHGVSLKYDTWKCSRKENVCCSSESFDLAKKIAKAFGAKHEIVDVRKLFAKEVIGYFTKELKNNRTPSPCVFCNPRVKFYSLLKYADKIGAKYVATGHYARVEKARIFGKNQLVLKKGRDEKKDQSYSLSFLPVEGLDRIIFPLGNLKKNEVYKLARKNKEFSAYREVKQSQDFCFLDNKDYERFIKEEIAPRGGLVVSTQGERLGDHSGLPGFTIGQRKGIGLAGGPYFVVSKNTEKNELVISKTKDDSYGDQAILVPFNLIVQPDKDEIEVLVQARSQEEPRDAKLLISEDKLIVKYSKATTQLVPGQIAVFYIGDICLGGGVIS
jgi:tRNA-specific 2-thiouridylase